MMIKKNPVNRKSAKYVGFFIMSCWFIVDADTVLYYDKKAHDRTCS